MYIVGPTKKREVDAYRESNENAGRSDPTPSHGPPNFLINSFSTLLRFIINFDNNPLHNLSQVFCPNGITSRMNVSRGNLSPRMKLIISILVYFSISFQVFRCTSPIIEVEAEPTIIRRMG